MRRDNPFLLSLAAWWIRQARYSRTRAALERLDPRTLRDVGLAPGEIASAAAELAGLAEPERRSGSPLQP